MPLAAVAVGSNLENPAHNVRAAVAALGGLGEVTAVSRLYASEPWGAREQPDFVNAVALVLTQLTPRELLEALQQIEQRMGRKPTYKWGPRLIDLDILYYDDVTVEETDLKIPHPHLFDRPFVLIPLAEIDARYTEAAAAADRAGLEIIN
jgi:2-amino-4-hydroxy-6-hydroxymethyldihydropteridine diphosphokinase